MAQRFQKKKRADSHGNCRIADCQRDSLLHEMNSKDGGVCRQAGKVLYKAAVVVLTPVAICLGVVIWSGWTILGVILDRDDVLPIASIGILAGLAVSASTSHSGGDAAVASAAASAISAAIGLQGKGKGRPLFALSRSIALTAASGYAIAVATRLGPSATSFAAAATSLSIILPILQLFRVARVWRWAQPRSAAEAEKRLMQKVLAAHPAIFSQGNVAGLHFVKVVSTELSREAALRPPLVIRQRSLTSAFCSSKLEGRLCVSPRLQYGMEGRLRSEVGLGVN